MAIDLEKRQGTEPIWGEVSRYQDLNIFSVEDLLLDFPALSLRYCQVDIFFPHLTLEIRYFIYSGSSISA